MVSTNRNSLLVAGIPRSRGTPVHIEHDDDTACCVFSGNTVTQIHTPQRTFERVHEVMHARHTNHPAQQRKYKRVDWMIGELIEDCRLHIKHWPWRADNTPHLILSDVRRHLVQEMDEANEANALRPARRGTLADFGFRLRQVAIRMGAGLSASISRADFANESQENFARDLIHLIKAGKEKEAAELLHVAFMGPLLPKLPGTGRGRRGVSDGDMRGDTSGPLYETDDDEEESCRNPRMEVIELPHEIKIDHAKVGKRRAVTGPRLHRPSLRKPILPQRLFVKRSIIEPGGTILVDASGSMGGWEQVSRWCEDAPFSTIAYYAGCGTRGQLFIYARKGRRATHIVEPDGGDNTIDGPAMTWLLKERGPRIMITDREFCGATDSHAQIIRLEQLEKQGLIEVRDYL